MRVCVFPRSIEGNAVTLLMGDACERAGVRYVRFDWWRHLFQPYEVFHVHWPDAVVMGRSKMGSLVKFVLFMATVARARARRETIVYTVHNIGAHDGFHPRLERLLWKCFLPAVSTFHHMNHWSIDAFVRRFPEVAGARHLVVPHPHYASTLNLPTRVDARAVLELSADARVVLNVGRVRPYKGVEDLIAAFKAHPDPRAVLLIAGKPLDDTYADALRALAADDPRIRLDLRFIADAEIDQLLAACDIVVLSHAHFNNSGVAVLAVSAGRAVLAPARGSIPDLKVQVGETWVTMYEDALTPADLAAALQGVDKTPDTALPDLSAMDPDVIGMRLADIYAGGSGGGQAVEGVVDVAAT